MWDHDFLKNFILKINLFIENLNTGGNDSVERGKWIMLGRGRIAGEMFLIKQERWDLVYKWKTWLLVRARIAHPLYQKRGYKNRCRKVPRRHGESLWEFSFDCFCFACSRKQEAGPSAESK